MGNRYENGAASAIAFTSGGLLDLGSSGSHRMSILLCCSVFCLKIYIFGIFQEYYRIVIV